MRPGRRGIRMYIRIVKCAANVPVRGPRHFAAIHCTGMGRLLMEHRPAQLSEIGRWSGEGRV